MNGRSGKILICILCGALLLMAGCATAPPPGEGTPAPAVQVQQAGPADLGSVISLLQTINERVSLVAENTRPEGKDLLTGNIVLFDSMGDPGKAITSGTALVALPQGRCDVAIFARSVGLFMTLEEEKDMEIGRERSYRNRQTCLNDPMCRRTVHLDNEYSFLYLEYKPYSSADSLSQVTLAYRCQPL